MAETTTQTDAAGDRHDVVYDALEAAFTAAGWKPEGNFQGGLDVVVAPNSLMVTTGVTGWGYGSGSVLDDGAWEPVEDIDGPSWSEDDDGADGSTPEVLAGRAVVAVRDWVERYRAARVTVRVRIDNVYASGGTVKTEATVTAPLPEEGDDELDDWGMRFIYDKTGTGRVHGDAMYFVQVVESSNPAAVPVGHEWEW